VSGSGQSNNKRYAGLQEDSEQSTKNNLNVSQKAVNN
jgi:hypothetical protein